MARTMTMGPQRPVQPAPKMPRKNPVKPQRAAPHGGGRGLLITLSALALAGVAGGLWLWLGGAPAADPGAQFLAQMQAAGRGEVVPTHAFGGTLTVVQSNGRLSVVADGVPSRACVQVGWRLAKEGTIIVNGTLPTRLSAAKLSDLCSGDGAVLTWVPDTAQ